MKDTRVNRNDVHKPEISTQVQVHLGHESPISPPHEPPSAITRIVRSIPPEESCRQIALCIATGNFHFPHPALTLEVVIEKRVDLTLVTKFIRILGNPGRFHPWHRRTEDTEDRISRKKDRFPKNRLVAIRLGRNNARKGIEHSERPDSDFASERLEIVRSREQTPSSLIVRQGRDRRGALSKTRNPYRRWKPVRIRLTRPRSASSHEPAAVRQNRKPGQLDEIALSHQPRFDFDKVRSQEKSVISLKADNDSDRFRFRGLSNMPMEKDFHFKGTHTRETSNLSMKRDSDNVPTREPLRSRPKGVSRILPEKRTFGGNIDKESAGEPRAARISQDSSNRNMETRENGNALVRRVSLRKDETWFKLREKRTEELIRLKKRLERKESSNQLARKSALSSVNSDDMAMDL